MDNDDLMKKLSDNFTKINEKFKLQDEEISKLKDDNHTLEQKISMLEQKKKPLYENPFSNLF